MEPVGLMSDGKRPDGATLISWAKGKPLALAITVPDIFAASNKHDTAALYSGAAANQASTLKTSKYSELSNTSSSPTPSVTGITSLLN